MRLPSGIPKTAIVEESDFQEEIHFNSAQQLREIG